MKFTAQIKNLRPPLDTAATPVGRRTALPVLDNVLLRLDGHLLTLRGTDLEIEMTAQAPVVGQVNGDITVPTGKLKAILAALPKEAEVTFELKEDRAVLRSGSSRFQLATLPAETFPEFTAEGYGEPLEVPSATLTRLIAKTASAIAQQDVRFYLNGLYIERAGGYLRAVASDGHRLSLCERPMDGPDCSGVIVPGSAVKALQGLLKREAPVRLRFASNAVQVESGDVVLAAKLIEGRFPDYNRVMPRELTRKAVLPKADLLAGLNRVALLSNEKYKSIQVTLAPEDGAVRLDASNPQAEQAEDRIEGELSGPCVAMGFNAAYLIDAVDHVDADRVVMEVTASGNSCLITDPDADDFKIVVMPMRL